MKKRFLLGLSIAILFIVGISIFAAIKPSEPRNVKPDPSQIEQNADNGKHAAGKHDGKSNSQKAKAAAKQPKSLFKKKDARVVAVGDSLTQGVGDSTKSGGYIGVLDREINNTDNKVQFDNFGHAGDRTDQLLKKIRDPKVSTAIGDADVVLITIGANDIMKVIKENVTNLDYQDFKNEQKQYDKRLHKVFKELQSINSDADIYLLGFYNPFLKYFQDIPELNSIVKMWNSTSEAATKKNKKLHYIPTKDLFDDSKVNLFYEDNFHPNDQGYKKMAERVMEHLKFK